MMLFVCLAGAVRRLDQWGGAVSARHQSRGATVHDNGRRGSAHQEDWDISNGRIQGSGCSPQRHGSHRHRSLRYLPTTVFVGGVGEGRAKDEGNWNRWAGRDWLNKHISFSNEFPQRRHRQGCIFVLWVEYFVASFPAFFALFVFFSVSQLSQVVHFPKKVIFPTSSVVHIVNYNGPFKCNVFVSKVS